MLPALLLVVLAAGNSSGTETVPDSGGVPPIASPYDIAGWHFAGVPLVSYGSDVGLTMGGALFFYRPLAAHPDEHHELTVSASYATRGPRNADVSLSMRRLFDTSLRMFWNVHLANDSLMPYWGEGAQLGGLPVPSGYGTPPEPYRYHDRRVFVTALLAAKLVGPLGWHLRARFLDVDVAEPSALLASSAPPGARGGRVALGELGLNFDTRDREIGARRGLYASVAAFVAPELGGVSEFSFHGYDATLRVYVPLVLGLTLAVRGLYDRKIPGVPGRADRDEAVPFFERMLYEGVSYNDGLGGASTIKGIARYRVNGEEKMLANVQLRATVLTSHLFSKTQEWGLDLGVDAGRATQPGYRAIEGTGATAGVRLIWDRALVLRVEMGRARGGDNTLYISFGEQF